MLFTHALFGAALGRIVQNRPASYLVGVASHALGDVLPHREHPLKIDAPLVAAALTLLGLRFGWASPECMGALGGITPDMEHLPTMLGWSEPDREFFPTHGPYPEPWLHSMGHTPEDDRVQIGLAVASLLVLCANTSDEPPLHPNQRREGASEPAEGM
ncbi:MAG: hypothetical protein KY468_21345 [Armatimonadetes bacterium]|nr:hypothetical protein [Armatimonadota bacterium]